MQTTSLYPGDVLPGNWSGRLSIVAAALAYSRSLSAIIPVSDGPLHTRPSGSQNHLTWVKDDLQCTGSICLPGLQISGAPAGLLPPGMSLYRRPGRVPGHDELPVPPSFPALVSSP